LSLLAGPFATLVGIVIGAPAGIFVGFRRGPGTRSAAGSPDALMACRRMILAIAAIAVFGPGVRNAMIAIGVVLAPRFYRVMRASAERISRGPTSRPAAPSAVRLADPAGPRVTGVMAPLVIQASLAIGLSMLGEIALSFIGLGVQPPDPSWARCSAAAYQYTRDQPLLIIIPGLAVLATVLSVNFIGEGSSAAR
jgi:peptide/nickel transport system permease protein